MRVTDKLDQGPTPLLKIISGVGYERFEDVYLVGGYVRDLFLERESHDLDFVIVGSSQDFVNDLAEELKIDKVVIQFFPNFGTVHFNYNGLELEFVSARKESYDRTSRKPKVAIGTLTDDLERRDFTINAIAISLNRSDFGELVDRFEGRQDIKKKVIRTVLDPERTFDDDPLRIMRAARFASQLGFVPLESDMIAAAKMINRLEIISQERISDELIKILKSPSPAAGFKILAAIGAFEVMFPELPPMYGQEQRADWHHKDVWGHTLQVLEKICEKTTDPWIRLAAVLHDVGKPQTKKFVEGTGWTFHSHEEVGGTMIRPIFERMKLPFEKIDLIEKLTVLHGRLRILSNGELSVTDSAIRRLIVAAYPYVEELLMLFSCDFSSKNNIKIAQIMEGLEVVYARVHKIMENDHLKSSFTSPVNGNEIMKFFEIGPGKKVGIIKSWLEEQVLEGVVSNEHDTVNQLMIDNKEALSEKIKDQ